MSEEDSIVTVKQIELGHQEDEPNTLFLTLTDGDGNVSRFNFSRTDLTALIGALIQMEAQGNAQRNLLQSPSRL